MFISEKEMYFKLVDVWRFALISTQEVVSKKLCFKKVGDPWFKG